MRLDPYRILIAGVAFGALGFWSARNESPGKQLILGGGLGVVGMIAAAMLDVRDWIRQRLAAGEQIPRAQK